jgi:hypothetical protein
VAIFIHLYEMYVGVQPSMWLFWRFFMLKVVSQHPPLIDGYYFQRRTQGHTPLGGAGAEDLGAPTINTKKHQRRAPERCRSW